MTSKRRQGYCSAPLSAAANSHMQPNSKPCDGLRYVGGHPFKAGNARHQSSWLRLNHGMCLLKERSLYSLIHREEMSGFQSQYTNSRSPRARDL